MIQNKTLMNVLLIQKEIIKIIIIDIFPITLEIIHMVKKIK